MAEPNWAGQTDEELVGQAQEGDHRAFAELMRRHERGCHKTALAILRDKQDAEEEVQNSLWKAFEHIDQFQREAKFSTWLTRIVVNSCLMRIRRDRRAKFVYMDHVQIGDEAGTLELRAGDATPEEQAGESEIAAVLAKEVRRIPPLLREVFLLREVHELPMPEVAGKLGISIPAAKSRLLRARLELRSRLEKYQGRLGLASLVTS